MQYLFDVCKDIIGRVLCDASHCVCLPTACLSVCEYSRYDHIANIKDKCKCVCVCICVCICVCVCV